MLRFCIITVHLLYCILLQAQTPVFTHQQRFKVEDGLPQNFISGVVQDKDGFLWIGTRDGLARYDGRQFKIFRSQYNDSNSISSSVVSALILDKQNLLWILYYNNYVECFDPRSFRVVKRFDRNTMPAKINETVVEPDFYTFNNEWYILPRNPRKGIAVFDFGKGKHFLYSRSNGYLSSDTVMAFTHDGGGNLWIVSPKGLQTTDQKRSKFYTIPFPSSISLKYDSLLRSAIVFNPKKSELVIADEEKFIVYSPSTSKFRTVKIPPVNSPEKRVVQYMQVDTAGVCYFIYDAKLYQLHNDSLVLLWKSPLSNLFRSIGFFVDRSHAFWYATDAGGLVKVDLDGFPINSFPYRYNFYVDALDLYGINSHILPSETLEEKWAYNFRYAYDKKGTLFFTLYQKGGYSRIYYRNGKLSSLPVPAGKKMAITGIDFDVHGNIVALDDAHKGLWYWKSPQSIPSFLPIQYNEYKVPYRIVDFLVVDDNLWISTEESGLYQVQNGKVVNRFHQRSEGNALPSDILTDMCRDPFDDKKFWIGSLGGGLILWDVNKGLQKVFTTADGLPNNTVYSIVPDKYGNLWLSTNNGFCRFNTKTTAVSSFNISDGLPGAEFNRFHHFKFPDGRIAFGGLEGFVVFNPDNAHKLQPNIDVQLTRIDVNNVEQGLSPKRGYLKTSVAQLQFIELPYTKNNLAIEFASPYFNKPEKIQYRYMLKGADKTWIESGNDNTVRYTNLRPGWYTFLVNASGAPGEWSTYIRELRVHILPPPWATWWAYAIYILMIASVVLWYLKYRERLIKMKEQIAYEHRESQRLKEIDEFKNRLFTNITHEFRTPLSLIIAPVEKLEEEAGLTGNAKEILVGINRNAHQLLSLINQMLDLSKLEAGKMTLQLSNGNLADFAEQCMETFKPMAAHKKIQLKSSFTDVQEDFLFDSEKLEKIIFNLLSNAIKFTPPEGKVEMQLECVTEGGTDASILRLIVKDTGIGISTENLAKVFDRFYQVDNTETRSYSGTGIGLTLVKELTEFLHGTVRVQSRPGIGTAFTIELPVQKYTQTQIVHLETERLIDQAAFATPTAKPLVLVAEDNVELRNFLENSLSAKWRIVSSGNGETAWKQILEELPDVVISDAMMPGLNGFELCSLVKKDNRTAHIGFIMLTAKAAHTSKMEGLQAGADDYLTKPFHLDELETRVQNLLGFQQKVRERVRSEALPSDPLTPPHVNDIFLKELNRIVDEKIDDPQLNVEYLSQSLTMSRSTLNRKLQAVVGISANEFIRTYRLQKAASLLAAGHDVTNTAYAVGFNTASYFSECFKQQYGKSPSEFAASASV